MNENHDRLQREEMARESRRDLVRILAGLLLVSGAITLVIAGALTWMGQQ